MICSDYLPIKMSTGSVWDGREKRLGPRMGVEKAAVKLEAQTPAGEEMAPVMPARTTRKAAGLRRCPELGPHAPPSPPAFSRGTSPPVASRGGCAAVGAHAWAEAAPGGPGCQGCSGARAVTVGHNPQGVLRLFPGILPVPRPGVIIES